MPTIAAMRLTRTAFLIAVLAAWAPQLVHAVACEPTSVSA